MHGTALSCLAFRKIIELPLQSTQQNCKKKKWLKYNVWSSHSPDVHISLYLLTILELSLELYINLMKLSATALFDMLIDSEIIAE